MKPNNNPTGLNSFRKVFEVERIEDKYEYSEGDFPYQLLLAINYTYLQMKWGEPNDYFIYDDNPDVPKLNEENERLVECKTKNEISLPLDI